MHLHAVFGESHFSAERQSAWIVRDQSVEILRDESTQAFPIASSGGPRVNRTGANQNQDQHEMLHGV